MKKSSLIQLGKRHLGQRGNLFLYTQQQLELDCDRTYFCRVLIAKADISDHQCLEEKRKAVLKVSQPLHERTATLQRLLK